MAESNELRQIIQGCKDGRSRPFSQLIARYSSRLYGYFYRLTSSREVSDELLSELFVKLVEKINSYRGGNFDAWLFKTASNIFYDHLRDKQRQKKIIEGKKEQMRFEPAPVSAGNEISDELQVQLGKIEPETRELIMLRFYSQLSFKEIAQMREEPIGTILSKVHRGLKKLKDSMER